MELKLSFEEAWNNIYELHYEQQEDGRYLVGIELNGCNLTAPIEADNVILKMLLKYEKSYATPKTELAEAKYAGAYVYMILYVINKNSLYFENLDGYCFLIDKCFMIFKNGDIYEYVEDEGWEMIRDINDAHPVALAIWKELIEKPEKE